MKTKENTPNATIASIKRKFNRLVFKTKAAIFTEAATPRVLAPLVIGTGFLAATWAGLWTILPLEAKIIGVVAFAAAAAITPLVLRSGSLLVKKKDAISRLDKSVDSTHRPAETLSSQVTNGPSANDNDKIGQALYAKHVQRTWNEWGSKLKAGTPSLKLNKYDPLRLRYALPLCAALAGFNAGAERQALLSDAFNWQTPPPAVQPLDIRAWVSPPSLPHLAPQYLDTTVYPTRETTQTVAANDTTVAPREILPVNVHEGSLLTIVVIGENARITLNGQDITATKAITADDDSGVTSYEYEIPMLEGQINVSIEGQDIWNFDITPDEDPNADIVEVAPDEENPNTLRLVCRAGDDYGLEGGRIIMRAPGSAVTTTPNAEGATPNASLDSAQLPTINLPRGRVCTP